MSDNAVRLPKRLPPGSTYVVESRGAVQDMLLVDRYVRLPDGRRIDLATRLVPRCGTTDGSTGRREQSSRRRALARTATA